MAKKLIDSQYMKTYTDKIGEKIRINHHTRLYKELSADTEFDAASILKDWQYEMTMLVKNTGSETINITFKNAVVVEEIKIDGGKYALIQGLRTDDDERYIYFFGEPIAN